MEILMHVLPPNFYPFATANIITGEGFDSIIGTAGLYDPTLGCTCCIHVCTTRERDLQRSSKSTPVYPTPRIN